MEKQSLLCLMERIAMWTTCNNIDYYAAWWLIVFVWAIYITKVCSLFWAASCKITINSVFSNDSFVLLEDTTAVC